MWGLILVLPLLHLSAACITADEQLLLGFKASLENGDQALKTWRNGTECCTWTGVSCGADGRVQRL